MLLPLSFCRGINSGTNAVFTYLRPYISVNTSPLVMSSQLFSLEGKVVVITGATKGIGEGMASGLAEAGAEIILVHRPSTDPQRVIDKLLGLGAYKVHPLAFDSSNIAGVNQVLSKSLELSSTGTVDVLINNAGIQEKNPPELHSDEQWERVLKVNLESPFKLARSFGKYWLDNGKRGKIINTGSLYSFRGGFNCVSYTASKSAIHAVTQALSNEWSSKGINVNTIIPGYIDTDLTQHIMNNPEKREVFLQRIPMARFGVPDDFKGPIVFLSSAASDYLTGGYIAVDGGFLSL
ncbi:kduD [Cyberlindnera jadinii]|uniref:KduD protein n=1 Tax=Cyberlindnera jadinii (strain ATCC 18201 / CBS 1600 / BCRC 20928 / JCM 3617 / NBRC 0987 / NRRL Y-1542) TaxID=983966 RepID=A0A0H5CA34_CYBJN|nr:kduD [Cyberlindnera jadinii]